MFSPNLSLPAQFFEHPIVIFQGPWNESSMLSNVTKDLPKWMHVVILHKHEDIAQVSSGLYQRIHTRDTLNHHEEWKKNPLPPRLASGLYSNILTLRHYATKFTQTTKTIFLQFFTMSVPNYKPCHVQLKYRHPIRNND